MKARWVNVVLGLWLLATAVIAGPSAPEFGDHLVVGLGVFLCAFLAMAIPAARVFTAAFGAWLVASPFALGFGTSAFALHDMVVGAVVLLLALFAPVAPPRRAPLPARPAATRT
jgi:hypothetical protein